MTLDELRVQAAEIIGGLDGFPEPWMRETFLKVPRHAFVPDTVWVWREDAYRPLHAADEPDTWATLVYDPLHSLVTQVDDGRVGGVGADARGVLPTSSISAPNAVFTMLAAADVRPGMKVLEIGTGTGYNATLLCERAGEANVVSVEVDAGLAEGAVRRLGEAGYLPWVVAGDGECGWADGAPYDRVLCTASLHRVPFAWVEQTRPGGLIVTPWKTTLQPHGMACLRVSEDGGSASGHFGRPMSFMDLRGQRRPEFPLKDVYTAESWDESRDSRTDLDLSFLDDNFHARFALGLRLPGVHADWEGDAWWFATADSWAYVRDGGVQQWGPRDLFAEVEGAYQWWRAAGQPELYEFGLTVTADQQVAWHADPDRGHQWELPA
ncbi:methyltransferase domain-containing protein [Streptomyces sp. NPDC005970]|uniref:methyltransferase domain-containing protein n=1 Tax=Streptomyces sp. NPDC005970 TaxID=3156723 RepID=UPI00340E8F41